MKNTALISGEFIGTVTKEFKTEKDGKKVTYPYGEITLKLGLDLVNVTCKCEQLQDFVEIEKGQEIDITCMLKNKNGLRVGKYLFMG